MSPARLPIELVDVESEADAIDEAFLDALQASDINAMRQCFTRLVKNHRSMVHILTELCEEVAALKNQKEREDGEIS